ncbi:carbohydrate binding domain-containing protein [Agarivorans sp. MS3-6]|uniref:carbohydrate binding domain-containing protein n=1 Tax=Agarivorans sp. TSD2052 TaxID=2937286 RepID=UPI0020100C68|nr:carbohydrate binding domain-containing protein [Agarivorans sp. TSD2052]UPW18310.1 carbohydrate binding domain-containing protein [Agarivorans sp. TSD2052]
MKRFFVLFVAISSGFLVACGSTGTSGDSSKKDQFAIPLMVTYTLNDGKGWDKVSAGTQGWGDGVGKFSLANEQANVKIRKKASNPWHIQLKRPVALVEDMHYELTVEASASQESLMVVAVQQNYGDYVTYFYRSETVSTENQVFTYDFTMPNDERKGTFSIMFGDGEEGVSYSLRNIKLNSTY